MAIVKRSKTAIINFPCYPSKYDLKIKSGVPNMSVKNITKYIFPNQLYVPTITHNEERDGNRTFFNIEFEEN